MKSRRLIACSFSVILSVLLCLCGCVSIEPVSPYLEVTSTPTPSAAKDPNAPPDPNPGPGGAGKAGDTPDDPPVENPRPSDAPKKEEPPKQEKPPEREPEPEEEPGRSKVGASPKIVDIQKNWRIVGEGTKVFQTPGIPGDNKMIVKLDLVKQGGATPVGAYTGKFSMWYYEMTPEMMQKYGATGDSHNEYETGDFTVEVVPYPDQSEEEWPYWSVSKEISVDITSITDITIQGRKQQVTDHPSRTISYSVDLNPRTGKAKFIMVMGSKSFIFDSGFRLESQ